MALAGQASTQALHVLPRHFSWSKLTDLSSATVMAPTGQIETHAPQLKHLSLSISTSFGKVTKAQVAEIAKLKAKDLNAASQEAANRIIEGTARSMGIEVV